MSTEADNVRRVARRVAGYFNGEIQWEDLTDDEREGILTSYPRRDPPWSESEGGVTQLRSVQDGEDPS